MTAAIGDRLRALLGPASVSEDAADRAAVAHDLWPWALVRDRQQDPMPPPDLVVWPRSEEEVAGVLRACGETGVAVVPLGAGTGVCGASVPVRGGVVLDLKRMDGILGWDLVSGHVRVQPGLLGIRLEEECLARGWSLGHYPASLPISTVGGFLSTRSVGQLSTRHGRLEERVAGLRVVLPDGTPVSLSAQPASGAGIDLRRLFLGAEGMLGVIVEATLRLHRVPERRVDAAFRLPGFEAGIEVCRTVLQDGLRPSVLRLYDPDDTALQHEHLGVQSPGGCLLLTACEGRADVAGAEAACVADHCVAAGAEPLGPDPVGRWLERRYELGYQQARYMAEPGMLVDTIEVAAPWSRLGAVYTAVKAAVPTRLFVLCHLSHGYLDGACLYFTFAGRAETEDATPDLYGSLWDSVMRAVLGAGGTIAHHHGVGLARSAWLEDDLGSGAMEVLRRLKRALDPAGVANPGKWALG